LTFDEHAAVTFQRLRRACMRVGTMDLKIAAIALSHEATLLYRMHPVARRDFPSSRSLRAAAATNALAHEAAIVKLPEWLGQLIFPRLIFSRVNVMRGRALVYR
jgi:hypothetical protein